MGDSPSYSSVRLPNSVGLNPLALTIVGHIWETVNTLRSKALRVEKDEDEAALPLTSFASHFVYDEFWVLFFFFLLESTWPPQHRDTLYFESSGPLPHSGCYSSRTPHRIPSRGCTNSWCDMLEVDSKILCRWPSRSEQKVDDNENPPEACSKIPSHITSSLPISSLFLSLPISFFLLESCRILPRPLLEITRENTPPHIEV